jgi:hypothetical protein
MVLLLIMAAVAVLVEKRLFLVVKVEKVVVAMVLLINRDKKLVELGYLDLVEAVVEKESIILMVLVHIMELLE